MSYQVLYRRFRPTKFSEVAGQDHITAILKNQIITKKISHAYLFSGSRGTGKTSTAKIFARAVNCFDPQDGEPCGICEYCTKIKDNAMSDIIEIDAASNRGIDEIRDLKDKVNYLPSLGKYRVYIIDEVHMLTTEAFNALLKTLEEPPEHIIFIFATTEPQKILPTILSRCQRFDFARLSQQIIVSTLQYALNELGISPDEDALYLIAANSDGAMRDAFSFADKAINIAKENILTLRDVQDALGLADGADVYRLAEALVQEDIAAVFDHLNQIMSKGTDVGQITNQLIEYFRSLMIYCNTPNPTPILGTNGPLIQSLEQCGKNIPADLLVSYITVLSKTKTDARYLPHPRYLLETALMSLSDRNQIMDRISLSARVDRLERQIEQLKTGAITVKSSQPSAKIPMEKSETTQNISAKPKAAAEKTPAAKDIEIPQPNKDLIAKAQAAIEFAAKFIHNRDRDILLADIFRGLKVEAFDGTTVYLYPTGTAVHMMDIYHSKGGEAKLTPILHDQLGMPVAIVITDHTHKRKEPKKDPIEKAKEIFGNLEELD